MNSGHSNQERSSSVVVALQNEDGKRLYFEQDIEDHSWVMVAMPVVGSDVFEAVYTGIPRGKRVHLDVPFDDFMQTYAVLYSAKPFFDSHSTIFLESVYLVRMLW